MAATPALTRRQILRIGVPVAMTAMGMASGGCAGRTQRPVEPPRRLPPDQVVFSVQGWPGLAPPLYLALALPELVVYGSGIVVWPQLSEGLHGAPPHVLSADVDPLAVARFAAEAAATGLLTTEIDYGRMPTPDVGATTVSLHGEQSASTTTVFGFHAGYETHLTRRQRARRDQLRDLIDRAHRLTVEADIVDHAPAHVVVLEQLDSTSDRATAVWPGPDPATFLHATTGSGRSATACGVLTGPAARTVYAAARGNDGQRWLVDGVSRTLVVNPLPLGIDC